MTTGARAVPPATASPVDDGDRIRTIASLDGLRSLEAAWASVAVGRGPIEQLDWIVSSVALTCDPSEVETVTVFRGDRLAAVAPLATPRVNGARRRVMLGVHRLGDPMDLLAADHRALTALAGSLAGDRRPIVFGRLPVDSPTVPALRAAFDRRWLMVSQPLPPCPYIPLDPTWQEPERHLNPGRRSDLRRALRRAERMGEVRAEILSPRPEEVDDALEEAIAVEARSWKAQAGTALACTPALSGFTRRYAHAAARRGSLRVGFLRIDGQAAAMQLAVVCGGGLWLLRIGYDPRFALGSPGMLLLRESIGHAAREGLRSYEFLGYPEPWIEVWTGHSRPTVELRAYPHNAAGGAALAADGAARVARAARKRVHAVGQRIAESSRERVRRGERSARAAS